MIIILGKTCSGKDTLLNELTKFGYHKLITYREKLFCDSATEDFELSDNKTIVILTPNEYKDFLSRSNIKHTSIYLYANNSTIKERLLIRGDNKDEASRRILQDNIDFKGVENIVNKIIYNNKNTNLNDVVNNILQYLEKRE